MENAARLRHGAGLYRDQTIETGTLSVLSFWHLQHCDTLTTCSSLLKECLLSPTDGIMSKDASSASQCDHVSRAPSENIIQNIQCSTQKESSKKWKYREFCEKCHLDCSVEPIACENPSVGSKFAANYPGRHLHISTPGFHTFYILWRGYLVISRQLTREFTPVWSQSPSSKYSNILKWVRSIVIVSDSIDCGLSQCVFTECYQSAVFHSKRPLNRSLHLSLIGESLEIFYWCRKLLARHGCLAGVRGPNKSINSRNIAMLSR